jgi:hypothetical protein
MNRRRHELQLESILNTQSKHTIEDSLRVPYVDRLPLKKVRFYVFTISHLCLRGTYLYPHGCSSANSLVSATETTGSGCAKPRGEVNLDRHQPVHFGHGNGPLCAIAAQDKVLGIAAPNSISFRCSCSRLCSFAQFRTRSFLHNSHGPN